MTMPHTNTASYLVHLEPFQTYEHTSNRTFGATQFRSSGNR